jgi:hypothetical protein
MEGFEMEQIKMLAAGVVSLGEQAQWLEGQQLVLICALAAMLQTHPDQKAFALALRQCWLQAGSQHSNDAHAAQTLGGIDSVLDTLEKVCTVPLALRPARD